MKNKREMNGSAAKRLQLLTDEVEGGAGDDGCLSYKKLYHASVERNWNLQEQLEKYSGLLSKHQRMAELKVTS